MDPVSVPDYTPLRDGHVSPFGRAVDAMRVRVHTPSEQVFAGIDGWYDVWVSVAAGHGERVGEARLEAEIGQVARLLFAARTREYYRLYELHLRADPLALRRNRERIHDAFESRSASGRSPGGEVELFTVGMQSFTVSIAPGTLDRLGSHGVGEACTHAGRALMDAWLQVIAGYKRERAEARR